MGRERKWRIAIKARETSPQIRMHAFRRAILCRGIDCGIEFLPRRKNQVFCSPACRLDYFATARSIGLILLEKSKCDTRLKVIIDGLLEILKSHNKFRGKLLDYG